MAKSSLKKELTLLDVYAIAMGTTLSSGFFLLPSLAFAEAGPAMITSYFVAALLVIPPLLSMVELSTAMPRAGGAYYFVDRAMGPLVGTLGGIGTWLVLVLKSAFALIGLGAYLGIFLPDLPLQPLAVGMAVIFGFVNVAGAKKSGAFQIVLVVGLLAILGVFLSYGSFSMDGPSFGELFDAESRTIFATAGLVYISYAGLTKVTSVAEEVHDPERNIVRGMLLALFSAVVVYGLGTYLIVSLVPGETLGSDLRPVASAADVLLGRWGVIVLTVAAILGFLAAANAGILSASRYPLAMSRDHLLPAGLRRLSVRGTPARSIVLTVALVVAVIVTLDPMKIAKLAGAFQLLMFAFLCLAVIVMRESRIPSYDPGFRSPWYPWLHVAGIISSIWVITLMGVMSIAFSAGLLVIGVVWFRYYGASRVERGGAIYHWFALLGERRYAGLDRELRGILKEKGLRDADPFDQIVARSHAIDGTPGMSFEEIVAVASRLLAPEVGRRPKNIEQAFLDGTRVGATPVTHGVALPHFRIKDLEAPSLVMVRIRDGVHVVANDPLLDHPEEQDVHAIFFLVSSENDPGQHLRILAQIAGRVDDEGFMHDWLSADDEHELKEVMLRDEHFLSLQARTGTPTAGLVGQALRDLEMPDGTLVALIRREGEVVVPRGATVLHDGDRLTVIGDPSGLTKVRHRFSEA